jgi:hypothetical protein
MKPPMPDAVDPVKVLPVPIVRLMYYPYKKNDPPFPLVAELVLNELVAATFILIVFVLGVSIAYKNPPSVLATEFEVVTPFNYMVEVPDT